MRNKVILWLIKWATSGLEPKGFVVVMWHPEDLNDVPRDYFLSCVHQSAQDCVLNRDWPGGAR